jgi:hypothetical protein
MVLATTRRAAATWEKESRRGGKLSLSETITEYFDSASGASVVTVRMVGVRTEHPVEERPEHERSSR